MGTAEIYRNRIANLRSMMRDKGLDAVIITGSDPHNSEYPAARWKQVEWISGFTGEAGDVVITMDHAGLWTDTRYFIQATNQLEGTGVELHKTRIPGEIRIPQWLAQIAFNGVEGTVAIAVDGLAMDVSTVDSLKAAFREAGREEDPSHESGCGFQIVDLPDMLEDLWEDRPAVPSTPVITLGDELTGESRISKIQRIRDFMEDKGCSAVLLTALDEIAWVLNVRASDVEYNPVCISYLLITAGDVVWYVRKNRPAALHSETADSFAELDADGIAIRDYDDVFLELSQEDIPAFNSLFVDPSSLNYHLSRTLSGLGDSVRIISGDSPVPLWKSVKNEVEIAGMKEAHFVDGLAMEKFLYWLDCSMKAGNRITEWDAAQKIDSLRAGSAGCIGNSFQTISAYGAGAALPHYVTPEHGSAVLEPHGLYLCDSGGQYFFGTTDLTRTVPLGPCTALEKEDYTLVLKGHIGLAMSVFPAGTSGCQVDYAARCPLWQYHRDYGHGTGHGVGFFLNVHEGPQEIRHNFNQVPLLPGMITSDEPGLYREGMHGVRHESLILCVDAGTNDFGTWRCFENLTLCHIDTSAVITEMLTAEEKAWLDEYNEEVFRTLSPQLPDDVAAWLREKTLPL